MKDFDQLVSLWQEQPKRDQLSVDEMLKQVKKGISGMSQKLLYNIVSMTLAIWALLAMMLFFVFHSWVTYIGITILIITILLYALMMVRDYRLINKRDITINPADYLQGLKEYQKTRAKIYGWMYYAYVLLISTGLLLYFYEVLQSASAVFKAAIYGLYGVLVLFTTFFVRERFVKSEQEKLSQLIDRLVKLQSQFD
jgi:RsiW-degrading membrane proteinase PrsW (M82 family)